MKEKIRKYAKFLIQNCLNLKNSQELLIIGNEFNIEFMNILKEEAEQIGSIVYFDVRNNYECRRLYLNSSLEEILQNPLFDRHIYNDVATNKGAFLFISSPIPYINDGVSSKLLSDVSKELEKRVEVFRKKQLSGEVSWCICAASNEEWASKVLPNSKNAFDDLWNLILDVCKINEKDPKKAWDEYYDDLQKRIQILNSMEISSLHYFGENGTDFTLELPDNYVFKMAKEGDRIVNMPSLEIFTTPRRDSVNGIVYSSKPLYYNGVLIDQFWFRFQHGRVIDYGANTNFETLKHIVETDDGSHYLGEVALVDYDSIINQSGIIFETTLYDENASCHLALGKGFLDCFQNGLESSKNQLFEMGMNDSSTHVDFMIGTRDLEIVATLKDGSEVIIMKHGKIIF